MKQKERQQLMRLSMLSDKVPFAHVTGATKSTSAVGMVDYIYDMHEFIPAIRKAMQSIAQGGYSDAFIDCSVDKYLDAISLWIDKREKDQWRAGHVTINSCFSEILTNS